MMIILYTSQLSNVRESILRDAIDAAEYNLGIPIVVYPMIYRAAWCLAKSNLAEDMVSRLHNNGFNDGAVRIFFLQKDIRTADTCWCFGATIGKTILLSDYRVWFAECTHAEKVAMLTYLIEHEVGHAFGVADDIRAEGIYDYHCFNDDCVMQQVVSVAELKEKARHVFLAHEEPGCFCEHCKQRFGRL